jgi:antitoxin (DNA-binding transcriptional repressor) of toxin-antitoxin stability system
MTTRITATELARNLSDILNRVRYQGETFRVERNGEVVAELKPAPDTKVFTVAHFRRAFGDIKVPEGMGADIEEARKSLGPLPEPPWR